MTIELVHGQERLKDPATVQRHSALYDELWAAALLGSEALDLIESYRSEKP